MLKSLKSFMLLLLGVNGQDQAFKIKHVSYDGNGMKVEEREEVQIIAVRKAAPSDTFVISLWLRNGQSGKWRDKPDGADDLADVIPVKVVTRMYSSLASQMGT